MTQALALRGESSILREPEAVLAVTSLREDQAAGLSYSALAGRFGISISHAWRIVNRRGWRQTGGGSDAGS